MTTRRPAGKSRRAERSVRWGAPDHASAHARWSGWLRHPALWSALAALLLALPALGFGFVRDDHALIEHNPFMRRDGWLAQLLASDFWGSSGNASGLWRPFTLLTYWVDGRLSGWNPAWFHAVNAVLHAATAALVALPALRSTASATAALIAGLWFAAMPAHVESVVWIAGRTDVLCALFFLLALVLDRRARANGARWTGAPSLIALALALASKEAAVPFVAVIAVAECREPRRWRERAAWVAPALALTVVYLVLHARFAGALDPDPAAQALLARRQWAGWTMLAPYVAFLWPGFPHSPELELTLPAAAASPAVVGGAIANLAMAAGIVTLMLRRSRAALPLALFWFPLLPSIGVAVVNGHLAFAERLLYLSSAGAAWLVALGIESWRRRAAPPLRAIAPALGAALVLWSALETVRLLPTWRNDATMFDAMVRVQPRNAKARVGRAETLIDRGREAEALDELVTAERLDPRLPEVHESRTILHLRRGEWQDALDRARVALALRPRTVGVRMAEAHALFRLGRIEESWGRVVRILADHPGEPGAEALAGQLLVSRDRPAEAIPHLEAALRWEPGDAALWYLLGGARLHTGQAAGARTAFEAVVRLEPAMARGWLELAAACAAAGDGAARDQALARAAALPGADRARIEALRAMPLPR